jgi:glutathione S-transferase
MLALEGMMNAKEAAKASEMAGEEIDRLGDPLATDEERQLRKQRGRTMSGEFSSLDAREKAAVEAALDRCRALADQIESGLRNERREFVDKISLAEFCVALERAADVLGQESRKSVENTPAPAVMGSWARGHSAPTDN